MTEQNKNKESEWFGFEQVSAKEKTEKVLGVFRSVADNYDIMNDAMSLGIHRIWKKQFIRMVNPRSGEKILDVAGGTGDISFGLYKKSRQQAEITISDINAEMLRVGRERAIDRGMMNAFDWVEANAEKLPFEDNSFDAYTISFGLRNVTHIDNALEEAHRVLKPGGRFYCLEFSHVTNPVLEKLYDFYSFTALPVMGKVIAKDKESYQYLAESIRQFPKQEELKERLTKAGFTKTKYTNLSHGIACIHSGYKGVE
ncbi:MAG: bifunctional demethylmenaquinone methyltransferase/2-methoxy-6-polyprenyl-1,4-benzoquinol methylase UbiE [Rickettsiales bacterium]|nr:bifunctional demethylmenaquinone methyltransferase/2-methoxy-6-polyprenyl-1,4-benzoquinol methylase UbiE [Rickettsiales bacterium]